MTRPRKRAAVAGFVAAWSCLSCSSSHNGSDCTVDAAYMPSIDPANFSTTIDNPLLPMPVGASWRYEGDGEIVEITVTAETRTVMGVTVVVVRDTATTTTGELIEDTRDWFAQASDGTVWYFGEETAEYENGEVVSTEGSWEAGVDGAQPGIIMEAAPRVGDRYRQEYLACEAEDMGEVVGLGQSAIATTGTYAGCVKIRDFTPLEPNADEHKTYCPGVGLVLVARPSDGSVLEELVAVQIP